MKLFNHIRFTLYMTFTLLIAFSVLAFYQTFGQAEFLETRVSALLFNWQSKEIPVIWYLVGAFLGGLSIGLFVAVYDHFQMIVEKRKLKKEVKELKQQLKEKESEIHALVSKVELAEAQEVLSQRMSDSDDSDDFYDDEEEASVIE